MRLIGSCYFVIVGYHFSFLLVLKYSTLLYSTLLYSTLLFKFLISNIFPTMELGYGLLDSLARLQLATLATLYLAAPRRRRAVLAAMYLRAL